MQRSTSFKTSLCKILSPLAIALLMAACSSAPQVQEDTATADQASMNANANTSQASSVDSASVDTSSVSNSSMMDNSATNAPAAPMMDKALLQKNSVYFDYDSSTVKDEYQPMIEAHAGNIKDTHAQKISIQGNTDKNGGREYNLALGQRRAETVRHKLLLLGVPGAQMEAVSFGKEKADGNDNNDRRADIAY